MLVQRRADDRVGVRKGVIGVAPADRKAGHEIRREVDVDRSCAGIQGSTDVCHGGERLVVDPHRIGRVGRRIAVSGDHDGDGLTGVADLVGRQSRRRAGFGEQGVGMADRHRSIETEIHGREHSDDAFDCVDLGDIDRDDARMCLRAPHECGVQHAVHPDVVHVPTLAGDESRVLDSAERTADHAPNRSR